MFMLLPKMNVTETLIVTAVAFKYILQQINKILATIEIFNWLTSDQWHAVSLHTNSYTVNIIPLFIFQTQLCHMLI